MNNWKGTRWEVNNEQMLLLNCKGGDGGNGGRGEDGQQGGEGAKGRNATKYRDAEVRSSLAFVVVIAEYIRMGNLEPEAESKLRSAAVVVWC
jgi:hypothetical protein